MAKILIIEDEESLIKNLSFALDKHQIISTTTAEEGLAKAIEEKPDLILLDLLLPGMDGIEVLEKLKADEKTDRIPVIVLTNLNDPDTVSKIMAAGGTEYFIKSDWGIDDLVKKIEQHIKK